MREIRKKGKSERKLFNAAEIKDLFSRFSRFSRAKEK